MQIQGRWAVLPSGFELNYDNFDKVLIEANKDLKFPLAALAPPRSWGVFVGNDEWEDYRMEMYFLNTTYYNGANQVSKKNSGTATSSKPVIEEWEEMKVAAVDFIRVLRQVASGNNNESIVMLDNLFRLHHRKVYIDPVSFVGSKRLSGVRLTFECSVYTTCEIQSYEEGGIVVLPESDESTFEAELIVVRNEVINILNTLLIGNFSMNYVIDAGSSVITTGFKGVIEWGFAATITGWTILSTITGSIVVDVWKDSYGNFEPTADDSIAGTEKPTLVNQKKNQDLDLTSFNTTVAAGDIWAFNVDSVSDVKKVTIAFRFTKTL